ncbi:apolipoprotein L3-like [Chionomys nivalis]|uniref:apolipoprotein L3-like n=1 Tax=Chionomys nivalis TaxID=269649 RepID=UPI002598734A|nr:apolipoprotein L3-like [Chionomys nivalis]
MAVTVQATGTLREGSCSRGTPLSIVDNITTVITNKVGRDDLKLLITEDGVWMVFVAAAELSHEEEADLRDALKKHLAQEPADENDETEKRQQKENFLKEFPELKRKLEENIRNFRALADHRDKVHRGCTISNVVSDSISIAATIFGLYLAPLTGLVSLMITAATLGAAAAATGVTTAIVEESLRGADESEARRLVRASKNILDRIYKIMPLIVTKHDSAGVQIFWAWKTLREHIQATRAGGTMKFKTTAKTESPEELRALANYLEEKLREFEQLHKDLQSF